jgi:hypothetical protein
MRAALRFLQLEGRDKLLLLRCLGVVTATRIGLTLLSFKVLRRWMQTAEAVAEASVEEERRVAWGVHHAARLVPAATCLTQALAGQFLLGRMGYRTRIRVGVVKAEDGRLLAHAWLLSCGRVVLGGSDANVERYTPLVDLDIGSA